MLDKLFFIAKPHSHKTRYTSNEVSTIHNRYRIVILILVVLFLWVMHHYAILDDVVFDISGGEIKMKEQQNYLAVLLPTVKWIASIFSVVFTIKMLWNKYIKKGHK